MKRLALILLLLIPCRLAAQQPPPYPTPRPPSGPLNNSSGVYDAKIVRQGAELRWVGASASAPDKSAAVLAAFAKAQPGDIIYIGPGLFDFGPGASGHVILPDHCTVRGQGRGTTTLLSSIISDTLGTSFALQNTLVEDLTMQNKCWYFAEDGRCIGFDNGQFGLPAGPFTATCRRCEFLCFDWCCYCWSPGNTWTLEDCDITTGRVGIAAENSGNGQDVTARRCRIFGDASLSNSRGETSNRDNGGVFGVITRGGPCRLTDCEITIKGRSQADQDNNSSWTPRLAAITDKGGGGSDAGRAVLTVYNLRTTITPNGSDPLKCFDIDLQYDYVQKAARVNWGNCWGMGADGTLKRSW